MNGNPVNDLIDDEYLKTSLAAARYVNARAIEVLRLMGVWHLPSSPLFLTEIIESLDIGISPDRASAFQWLLEEAALSGCVTIHSEATGIPLYEPLSDPGADRLSQSLEGFLECAGANGSSVRMIDHVADNYPDFLTGRKSGMSILFKGRGLQLWEDYFCRTNPLYEIHNTLATGGLLKIGRRLRRPLSILELGAGTGGATRAIIDALQHSAMSIIKVEVTDISPSMLLRTQQRISKMVSEDLHVEYRRLDFTKPMREQGVLRGSADVVLAVNALHNAAPGLVGALKEIQQVLAADGVLIISESLCASKSHAYQDFIFNLLPVPGRAPQPDVSVSGSRFFSFDVWRSALIESDFTSEVFMNAVGPELAMLAIARPAIG